MTYERGHCPDSPEGCCDELVAAADRRLRAALDSMLDPHIVLRAEYGEGSIVSFICADANTAACAALHIDHAELVGSPASRLLPVERGALLFDLCCRTITTGEAVVADMVAWAPPDAETRYYDLRATRADSSSLSVTWRDVTERGAVVSALAESEELYRGLYEGSPIAIELYDTAGRLIKVNAACRELFGVADERELAGFDLFADPNVDEEHKKGLREGRTVRYQAAFDFEAVRALNLYHTSRAGTAWLDVLITPLGARTVGYLVQVQEITRQREAAAALQRRLAELDALQRISELLVHRVDLQTALDSVCDLLQELYAADSAEVHLVADGDELSTAAGAVAGPALGVPLVAHGEPLGRLVIVRDAGGFSTDERLLAHTAGDLLAAVIWIEQLHELETQEAAVIERRRIARDLHDAVTQSIYSANMLAEALPTVWERDREKGREDILAIQGLIRAAFAELRMLLYELRPETLAGTPIETLFERLRDALIGRAAAVRLTIDPELDLPPDVRIAFYRIAQEALGNAGKYAAADRVDIQLRREGNGVELTVRDDGRGFSPGVQPSGLGQGIMRERAESIGAQLTTESAAGAGTTVRLLWRRPDVIAAAARPLPNAAR